MQDKSTTMPPVDWGEIQIQILIKEDRIENFLNPILI